MSFSDHCPIEGGKLYYDVTGKGEPLVLIHAGIAHSEMWDEQVKYFSKNYQVIRYDLRAEGQSRSEIVRFAHYKDLAFLVEHLQLTSIHLCGASMGGRIALEYALTHPDTVKSLVMCGTGLVDAPQQSEQEKQLFEAMDLLEEAGKWHDVAKIDVRLFVDGPNSLEGRADAAIRQKVHDMALSNYLAYYESFPAEEPQNEWLSPLAVEQLSQLSMPVLSLVGDLDMSRAQLTSELFSNTIRQAKQITIKDTAHLPNLEKADLFNQHVFEFLSHI